MERLRWKRTDYCGELRETDIDREVVVAGWVQRERDLGSLLFLDLRDTTGIVQAVVRDDQEIYKTAKSLGREYVVMAKGQVARREAPNKEMPTGEIEILLQELQILNVSETPPIYIQDDDNAQESLRLRYRYLDLRKGSLQKRLRTRAKICRITGIIWMRIVLRKWKHRCSRNRRRRVRGTISCRPVSIPVPSTLCHSRRNCLNSF